MHHITSDLANLSLHQQYNGSEEVLASDGTCFPIINTGFTSLPSNTGPLSLTNVLHFPDIKKKLIFIYHLCNANNVSVGFPDINRHKQKPNTRYALTATSSIVIEPRTVTQGLSDEKWRRAMLEDFDAQLCNFTWSLVPPAPHQNLIGMKWVFKLKYLSDDSVHMHKARLVAKGYNQKHGIDYTETFSPVINATIIRVVLQTAVASD